MINKLIYKYYNECNFVYDGTNVKLPDEMIRNINTNWEELIASGKEYTNGELYTVSDIFLDSDKILKFVVNKTNYAHHLYSNKNDYEGAYRCRSIAANVLPVTTDNYYVLGVMANWTSMPNTIKFIGGAMDKDDLIENRFEPLNCARREMIEEIGIDLNDREYVAGYEPIYFITRKNLSFINVLHRVRLNLSSAQIKSKFEQHKSYLIENKMEDELDSILLVKNDLESNKLFINSNRNNLIGYMESVFNVIYGIEEANDIINEVNNNCSMCIKE